ncbi:MAG: hypothetical protein HOE48_22340 [Candidatus Latescibacteria bacterium]|nr:hypothetical protein [Candidatus Latescibacterota bacterium]MBT4140668.1 hypothetical protein [Candidatus Latescibacterota bacterium]MBT5829427.1 hypothetical protein [Candidatus Latescibacterota bacterium]
MNKQHKKYFTFIIKYIDDRNNHLRREEQLRHRFKGRYDANDPTQE